MSNTKSGANNEQLLYNRYFEAERVISKVVVTDEGVFKEGELPEDYGGASLELDVVHSVSVVNSLGQMLIIEFAAEEAMDKDRKTGGPVKRDGEEIAEQTGESNVPTEQTTKANDKLPESHAAIAQFAKSRFVADRDTVGDIPKGM